jgi:hypothetical protein
MLHAAAQWPSRVGRALLPARADDSHSNLGWDEAHGGLFSHRIEAGGRRLTVGVAFADFSLQVVDVSSSASTFSLLLLDGKTEDEVRDWLGAALGIGAERLDFPLPYDLPAPELGTSEPFSNHGLEGAMHELGRWYANAALSLSEVHHARRGETPGPSPVRCWPHHFDIATLVALEAGDPEHARSIGVGFAPGDAAVAEPYFYVNPWPVPDPRADPVIPAPGHWHTQGFTGAVATAADILAVGDHADDQAAAVLGYLRQSYDAARGLLFG